jgi:tRNA nucleotidyltransferase (CCA-adding enzyme)
MHPNINMGCSNAVLIPKGGTMTELELMQSLGHTARLYRVGGCVRDMLLGKKPSDVDYVITGVSIEDIKFPKIAGKDFPVFLVKLDGVMVEIAMARSEKKVGVGYSRFEFYTDPAITIEQDLLRRDLTINAMAIDVETGELIDPFEGQQDLHAGILRHTSDAFREDPLRVYRVARFASKFGYRVHPDTRQMMLGLRSELSALTPERVALELSKALVEQYPDKFFRELDGLLDVHFPEVETLKVPDKHDGTAFNHTLACLYRGRNLYERWGLLVHDLGKGLSESPPIHNSHDKHTHLVYNLGERLRLPNKLVAFGATVMSTYMKLKHLDEMRPGKLFRLIKDKSIFKLLRLSYLESGERYDRSKYMQHVQLAKKVLKIRKSIKGQVLLDKGVMPDQYFGQKLLQEWIREFKRQKNAG